MRKTILKIHRWLAIPFGAFIFIICLTGAVMAFQDEILDVLNHDLYHLEATGQMLPDSVLAEKVRAALPEEQTVTFIRIGEEGTPAQVNIAGMGQKNLLVNPYTGEVLGYPRYTAFFDMVKSLHRWLLNKPDNHQQGTLSAGRVIMGSTAIAMTIILLSGIYLWWPRNMKMLKNRLKVSTGKGFRRFVYDSHVSLGIYAATFLLLMSLTGPVWSFQWYKQGAQTVLAMQEDHHVDEQRRGSRGNGQQAMMPQHGVEHQDQMQGESPQQKASDINIMHTEGQQKQPMGGFHILVSQLHMGKWGGWFIKLFYLLAALIGATLPLSGYYMWWKRTMGTKR